jgi:hypothetical protein
VTKKEEQRVGRGGKGLLPIHHTVRELGFSEMVLGSGTLEAFVLSQLQLQLLDGFLQRGVLAQHLLQLHLQLIVHDLRLALGARAGRRLISLRDPSLDALDNHRALGTKGRLGKGWA